MQAGAAELTRGCSRSGQQVRDQGDLALSWPPSGAVPRAPVTDRG
jgi:hypothetical protein